MTNTNDDTRNEVTQPFNGEAAEAQPEEPRYHMFIKTPLLYLNMKRFPKDPLYKNCLRSVRYSTTPPHHWGKAAPSYKPWE